MPPAIPAAGRPYLAIPGPSVMPDRVLAAMHRPAPDIYGGEILAVTERVRAGLKAVAQTRGDVAIYIGNGHAAWEAANTNLFSRGARVLMLVTGRFAENWARALERLGVIVERIGAGEAAADPGALEARLRADRAGEIRAVLLCQIDTATSLRSDVPALGAALRAAGHPALLVVDAIASLGCEPMRMDEWGVDVLLAASQKGLMTPPGLAFVWLSARAYAAADGADLGTPYWDWRLRARPQEFWQIFGGTAPTHHLYGLAEALAMIEEEGLEAVWARHARLARAVHAAVEAWGAGGDIALHVARPEWRAASVTALRIGGGGAAALREWCARETGVSLGIGLGMVPFEDHLRIAHMGHVNAHMTLGALGAMEAGLCALGIGHGAGGVSAAARALAS